MLPQTELGHARRVETPRLWQAMNERSSSPIAHTLPLLDWLRFGAALMVVLKHSKDMSFPAFSALPHDSQAQLFTKALYALTRYGDEAVLVFFVLSGYLVGGSTFNRLRLGTFDLWSYASDRSSRILLPLLPAILFTLALQSWRDVPASPTIALGNALSVQGVLTPILLYNPSLWTLTYEVWFYILNGALVAILASKTRVFGSLVVFLALALFSVLKLELLICWYLGVFAYFWVAQRPKLVSALTAAGLVGLATALEEMAGQPGFAHLAVAAHLLLGFSVVLLVRQMAAIQPIDSLMMRLGSRLSDFSYSLYLIHYPILFLVAVWFPPAGIVDTLAVLRFLFRVAVSLLGGYLFYCLFERHTPRVRRLIKSWRMRSIATGERSHDLVT